MGEQVKAQHRWLSCSSRQRQSNACMADLPAELVKDDQSMLTASAAPADNSNSDLQVFQPMLGTYWVFPNLDLSTNMHQHYRH